MRRKKISKSRSKRMFTKNATRVHKKNNRTNPMRGGIRLQLSTMPCYKPLHGYRSDIPNDSGKFPILFKQPKGKDLPELELPCSRCIGCRLEHSRQWALRIMHEASLYAENSFITLTYDEHHLPSDQSLNKKDWQDFLKRLRKSLGDKKIRFYMCGEYGQDQELLQMGINAIGRPHFHAIIFGHQFPDLVPYAKNDNDDIQYTSKILENLWGKGFVTVGDADWLSAAYVARYVTKKITGDMALDHYSYCDHETGETFLRQVEFSLMSRRPGIARDWFDKYKTDLDKGFITFNGRKMQPPKYYDSLFEKEDPWLYQDLKEMRELALR